MQGSLKTDYVLVVHEPQQNLRSLQFGDTCPKPLYKSTQLTLPTIYRTVSVGGTIDHPELLVY